MWPGLVAQSIGGDRTRPRYRAAQGAGSRSPFHGDSRGAMVLARAAGSVGFGARGRRSEERRVGKACVSPCRSRRSPPHSTNKTTTTTPHLHLHLHPTPPIHTTPSPPPPTP